RGRLVEQVGGDGRRLTRLTDEPARRSGEQVPEPVRVCPEGGRCGAEARGALGGGGAAPLPTGGPGGVDGSGDLRGRRRDHRRPAPGAGRVDAVEPAPPGGRNRAASDEVDGVLGGVGPCCRHVLPHFEMREAVLSCTVEKRITYR